MAFIKKKFGLIFICVILFVMVNAGEDQIKSDLEEMKAGYELTVKRYNSGDIDGYFSLIHDDVVYCLTNPDFYLEGKKAVRNFYDNMLSQAKSAHWENIKPKFFVNGNTGFLWGPFRHTVKSKDQTVVVVEGFDTEIFTKLNGKWMKIFEHISVLKRGTKKEATTQDKN
jgi:ketosteroid isomerase-like protein